MFTLHPQTIKTGANMPPVLADMGHGYLFDMIFDFDSLGCKVDDFVVEGVFSLWKELRGAK